MIKLTHKVGDTGLLRSLAELLASLPEAERKHWRHIVMEYAGG